MIITKITTILPEENKHFSSAWDSTATTGRTLDNLVARLTLEETKAKMIAKEEESVLFKTVNRTKGKASFKCFKCNQVAQNNCPCMSKSNCSICKRNNHAEKDCYLRNKECTICRKNEP
jgi:hypothetical protein